MIRRSKGLGAGGSFFPADHHQMLLLWRKEIPMRTHRCDVDKFVRAGGEFIGLRRSAEGFRISRLRVAKAGDYANKGQPATG